MASLFARGAKLYAKIQAVDGTRKQIATGRPDTPDRRAEAATGLSPAAWIRARCNGTQAIAVQPAPKRRRKS